MAFSPYSSCRICRGLVSSRLLISPFRHPHADVGDHLQDLEERLDHEDHPNDIQEKNDRRKREVKEIQEEAADQPDQEQAAQRHRQEYDHRVEGTLGEYVIPEVGGELSREKHEKGKC